MNVTVTEIKRRSPYRFKVEEAAWAAKEVEYVYDITATRSILAPHPKVGVIEATFKWTTSVQPHFTAGCIVDINLNLPARGALDNSPAEPGLGLQDSQRTLPFTAR